MINHPPGQHQSLNVAHVSAPGKIILCGEHAVVYGQDALAMAISLRLRAVVKQIISGDKQLSLSFTGSVQGKVFPHKIPSSVPTELSEYKKQTKSNNDELVKIEYKIGLFMQETALRLDSDKQNNQSYLIQFSSDLPIGKCLGSSAAFNTVLTAVLFIIYNRQNNHKKQINLVEVNRISKVMQKIQHGTPSGIDNYVSTFGGLVLYNNMKNPPFQSINQQSVIQRLTSGLRIWLMDSGVQKNTKKAVTIVREKYEREQKYKVMIKEIGTYARKILSLLSKKEYDENWQRYILEILSHNHDVLRQLGVSIAQIEKIVQQVTKVGERSAKITGAGMGGYVLVVEDQNSNELQQLETALKTKMDPKGLIVQYY